MNKTFRVFLLTVFTSVIALCVILAGACSPDKNKGSNNANNNANHVDYVSDLHLDFSTETKKQEVTVRLFIDGDTTHFNPVTNSTLTGYNASDFEDTLGYIKARYLAINTPESTGQIEEWGKKASKFTRSKLEPEGTKIVVESDVDYWDIDSTGERYLLWVWYRPPGATEFRNLNVEILQEGLAYASRTSEGIYGDVAMKALNQAKAEKLNCYSGEKDPDFYYGGIQYVSLKELRCFPDDYEGTKVSVDGIVVAQFSSSVYIEAQDLDTGLYFGMQIYCGPNAPYGVLDVLVVGNKVEVVGTFAYSDIVNAYQISGLAPINTIKPDSPTNCKVIEEGVGSAFTLLENPEKLNSNEKIKIVTDREDEDGNLIEVEMTYGEAVLNTSVTVENLLVNSVSTTETGGNSDGAMTLNCTDSNGNYVKIRTEVLKDENGNMITYEKYKGKHITVKGIIELYYGTYQIKSYRTDYIIVLDEDN